MMCQLHERDEKGPIDVLDTVNPLLLIDIEPMKVKETSFDQINNDWLELVTSKCMQVVKAMQELDIGIEGNHIK